MDLLTYGPEQGLMPISDDLRYEGPLLRPAGPEVVVRVFPVTVPEGAALTATGGEVNAPLPVEGLAQSAPLPEWFESVVGEVVNLTLLPVDWDSYGGQPVSLDAAGAALTTLLGVAHEGLQQPSVVPDSEGGVGFEWESPEAELMLVVRGDNEGTFFFEDLAQPNESEGTLNDLDELSQALQNF